MLRRPERHAEAVMSSHAIKSKRVLGGFLLCGLCDFVFGFAKARSLLDGVVAVVAGLPLSALVVFAVLRVIDWRDQGRSDDFHEQH